MFGRRKITPQQRPVLPYQSVLTKQSKFVFLRALTARKNRVSQREFKLWTIPLCNDSAYLKVERSIKFPDQSS